MVLATSSQSALCQLNYLPVSQTSVLVLHSKEITLLDVRLIIGLVLSYRLIKLQYMCMYMYIVHEIFTAV